MAKYAQGYTRKNSDSKNLIIMASIIVGVVVLAITFVILYNKLWKKTDAKLSDSAYTSYYLSDYSALLDQDKKEDGNYLIYVTSTDTNTTDPCSAEVVAYIAAYEKGTSKMKIYLLDYSAFDSTSDTTETGYATKVKTELGFSVSVGYLIYVQDNEIINKSKQLLTDSDKVKSALSSIEKDSAWPYPVK